jgi:hypothetical protein
MSAQGLKMILVQNSCSPISPEIWKHDDIDYGYCIDATDFVVDCVHAIKFNPDWRPDVFEHEILIRQN